MLEHLKTHPARPAFLLAAGIAIGALLAPAFGGGAQAVTTYTRAVSCQGINFQPITDTTGYDLFGTRRIANNSGYFVCNPNLPNKAVVTKVRFTLFDDKNGGNVNDCALVRAGLTAATVDTTQVMAAFGTTNDSGLQRMSDTSISYPTIDNLNYAYYLQCQINPSGYNEGIYGADITYKITAANG